MQQVTKEANYLTPTIHYINETEVRSCFTPENNKVVIRKRIRKVESTHLPNPPPCRIFHPPKYRLLSTILSDRLSFAFS